MNQLSEQQQRLQAVREVLTARGLTRQQAAFWVQRYCRLQGINSGGLAYQAVLRAAREA